MPTSCHPMCKMSLRESKKNNLYIKFHQFPKNHEEKMQWLANIGQTINEFRPNWKLCSLHFKKSDYDSSNKLTRISVPNLIEGEIAFLKI